MLFSQNSLLLLTNEQQPTILFYVISGTIIIILFILFAIRFTNKLRINKLNWYEQNLNEIATSSSTSYVRCKALPRLDTIDDLPDDEGRPPIRKQSRIHQVNQHSLDILPSAPISSNDPNDIFIVPRLQRQSNASQISMFNSLDQCQLDRGLYTTLDQVPESEYDERGSCGNCGSIKLSLNIDSNLNLLTVSLRQAIDLIAKRQDGQPNPYFKVALDIPENPFPKIEHKSKICKGTSSPIICEDFFFQIPQYNFNNCRLEIIVFDYDQCSVDECIGYCSITLGRLSKLSLNHQTILWAEVLPIEEENEQNGFGEALFSLSYLSRAQPIAVRVSLFVKRTDRKQKRKKTSSKKINKNVQFNESLTFHMPKCSLCDSILKIEIIHEHGGTFGMVNKILGKIELPLHKCRELWRTIIHEENAQARWNNKFK
ncbi:C2 domain-containing protein [Meloidogyne graminicola]|uniref:C2 domain-containing protein n=1 Tax=Meloidogyne graminicola TaxID=189291 RepID=A0A8S9ZW56_9BILA|nr:C2 domain-containing protein [Meloidogyne graminicola]